MDCIRRPNQNQVNNVSLGNKWSQDIPIGPAYRYLDIVVTMTTASSLTASLVSDFIDLTTIYANGKPWRQFLGKEANSIYSLLSDYGSGQPGLGANYGALIFRSTGSGDTLQPNGLTNNALKAPVANDQTTCILRIYFEEPWRKSWSAASSRKFYTQFGKPGASTPLSSFQIESLLPSTTNNAGATSVSVRVLLGFDNSYGPVDAKGNPITNALSWQRYPGVTYTASGDLPLNNLVRYNKGKQLAILEQMDIFSQSSGDDVGRLQVNADGRVIFDATNTSNLNELVRHNFNGAGLNLDEFHFIPDVNDVLTDGLVLSTSGGSYITNLNVTATLTAAAGGNKTLAIINQVYKPLD